MRCNRAIFLFICDKLLWTKSFYKGLKFFVEF